MSEAWQAIFDYHGIAEHDFQSGPFIITAEQIRDATSHFRNARQREVRLLCKHDTRESRPQQFSESGLFILPLKSTSSETIYAIVEGEGYVDIPVIEAATEIYQSQLDFRLDTSEVGNSEMQHVDYAYATSLIRTFMQDDSLVLTIRGRKYTPEFSLQVGKHKHELTQRSVQTEVDAGYEGREQVVLVEAKNAQTHNVIIRQLYYPFRQWSQYTDKPVKTLFFEKRDDEYSLWRFGFDDVNDYNSIRLEMAQRYKIVS